MHAENSTGARVRKNNYEPFGFDQGDPLIVCINDVHMKQVQDAFQIKAYYCIHGASICGRRHDKAIIFNLPPDASKAHIANVLRWIKESVHTSLTPGGKIYYV